MLGYSLMVRIADAFGFIVLIVLGCHLGCLELPKADFFVGLHFLGISWLGVVFWVMLGWLFDFVFCLIGWISRLDVLGWMVEYDFIAFVVCTRVVVF